MENDDDKPSLTGGARNSECVRVAVNIRPLITSELMHGCTDCISVVPGEPQIQIGSHGFTFDYVFGNGAIPCGRIYDECVASLVDALFHGYNGTVLAYGQTGSGKTYTMGTNYNGEENSVGIIPKVMESIFSKVESMKDKTEFFIRVSFIEIFKEEVFDLLDHNQPVAKVDCPSLTKPTAPARIPIQIRETVHGGITLAGVTEAAVRTKEEMASNLSRGSLARATGSTNMNSQSSRSHAIFTISMDQKKITTGNPNDQPGDDILSAKLHLVDLAGSERAKRTGADGMRLREGIHINKGLLALGNVISALGDEKKRKEGGHVPYRDSKLTRLLQDSLGGNSKTIMIACVSPADTNAEETLNTLKYANRARNIHNKAVINRDPVAAQMQRMRSQIDQLQSELLFYRADTSVPFEELQILKHKVSLLEASNSELQRELQDSRVTCGRFSERAIEAQVEKDKLIMKIEAFRNGKSWDELETSGDQGVDLVKGYISKIQELEEEVARRQKLHIKGEELSSCIDFDDEAVISRDTYLEGGEDAEELEHCSLQERLDMELKELDKRLEQKEAEMKSFANVDTVVMKQHYEKKVQELEYEKRVLQNEIEALRRNLSKISSSSDDNALKLKEGYLQKLNGLEAQVSELKKKQEAQTQVLRQKQKSDDAAKRLQEDIHRIKCQKVQLQNKIKQESERFRLWKAAREKEVLQLKKEGRRNEYEMHKLLALNQRQKMVLQRKTEEAALAAKRLKEVLDNRKAGSRDAYGAGSGNGPVLQELMQAIEHELEVTVRVHEVRSEYERQKEERAKMAQEVARLKEEDRILRQNAASVCPEAMSPSARNSRIFALESMLATSSGALVSMASHLSEAEERERLFSGKGRWNHVRSLSEAKNLMNHLFNLASSSRCELRDKEVECREKDADMKELKEKVFNLNTMIRQLELQNTELIRQLQQRNSNREFVENANAARANDRKAYDLRQGPRASGLFNFGNYMELLEDMDTSDSERSNSGEDTADGDWVETVRRTKKKMYKNKGCQISGSNTPKTNECDHLKMKLSGDLPGETVENFAHNLCCTCSKFSFCKTSKCECRAGGACCSASCGCSSRKCSNRDTSASGCTDDTLQQKPLGRGSLTEEDETHLLASQGAALLHNALAEMPAGDQNEEIRSKRKPLSDIGNTTGKPNASKPEQRKKWKKSVIQLVPAYLPPPAQSENAEPARRPETSLQKGDASLKLPRAMRSATSNSNNYLRDRNTDQQDEHAASKDSGIPAQRAKKSEEKENKGI